MAQTAYNKYLVAGFAGQFYDNGPRTVLSYSAQTPIPLGAGVVLGSDDHSCRVPAANIATVTYSVDFVASNVIALSINGVAISPVTYATSQANTLALLVTAIQAVTTVPGNVNGGFVTLSATSGTDKVTITCNDPSVALTVTSSVTGGAGQPTVSVAYTTSDTFIGVAAQEHSLGQDYNTGAVIYPVNQTVAVMSKGRMYVNTEVAVTSAGGPVYCRYVVSGSNGAGDWLATASSSSAFQVNQARWFVSTTGAGVGVLELNLP